MVSSSGLLSMTDGRDRGALRAAGGVLRNTCPDESDPTAGGAYATTSPQQLVEVVATTYSVGTTALSTTLAVEKVVG
jgi:hypothetical protein